MSFKLHSHVVHSPRIRSRHFHESSCRNLGNFVHLKLPEASEESLKAGGPFYLVSTPGEVKGPTQGANV